MQRSKDKKQSSDRGTDTCKPDKPGPGLRVVASLQKFVQYQSIPAFSSVGNLPNNQAPLCEDEPLTTSGPFPVREYKGKRVRDVWMDTHDLLNEPGGFVINLTRHGEEVSKNLRIHLGIRQKLKDNKQGEGDKPELGSTAGSSAEITVKPGTITTTDDYAREIFRGIRANPFLECVSAVLEINDEEDTYEQKVFQDASPEFLRQFIQTYPTKLVQLQMEMPGLSALYLPEWKFLLEQQTCLQVLICNLGVVMWKFYERGIIRNGRTLERIVLRRIQSYDITTGKYVPLDWGIFMHCQKLVHLKVTCGAKPVYKYLTGPNSAAAPSSVFLHENIDKLPDHDTFAEFHLSKIWIEPCAQKEFSERRPNLQLCLDCNDMEYYDADMTAEEFDNIYGAGSSRQMQVLSISRFDLKAEITPNMHADYVADFPASTRRPHRPSDRRLGCIVLALFQAIVISLAILFIIIYFRHWRSRANPGANVVSHHPELNETETDLHGDSDRDAPDHDRDGSSVTDN